MQTVRGEADTYVIAIDYNTTSIEAIRRKKRIYAAGQILLIPWITELNQKIISFQCLDLK